MTSFIHYQTMTTQQLNEELVMFCRTNNVEGVKYLLTSPDMIEHPDVHYKRDIPFRAATNFKSIDVLHYLVFDYRIEHTMIIQGFNSHTVKRMFEVRDLDDKLQKKETQKTKINKI